MKSSSLLVLLVALAAGIAAADQAAAHTVADTCNAIRDLVDYAFCTAALRSAGPGAATADRHAHLLLAADLAASQSASAGAAASALARSEGPGGDDARDGLEACAFLYGASSVPALRLFRAYAAARAWDPARSLLLLTAQGGIGCDAAFGKGKAAEDAKGRMAAANREFEQLSILVTALLNNQG